MIHVPHNRLSHGPEEAIAVDRVVRSGQWAMGPETALLEHELALYAGRRRGVATGSGLGALRLALLAMGVGQRDEVIVPAYCCVALPNAILACGALPIQADIIPREWTIDPRSVANLVGKRTKAIVAVHTFGVAARIEELRGFGVPVIEDCAHGIGRGSMGGKADLAITSLYATKLLGAGEGGAVLGDDDELLDTVAAMRDYTDQNSSPIRMNDKMTDLSAALARVQLAKIDTLVEQRHAHAVSYDLAFADLASGAMVLPFQDPQRIWYRYAIELRKHPVDEVIACLGAEGIGAVQPVWRWDAVDRSLPNADQAYRTLVSIPLYPTLTEAERHQVHHALERVLE